MKTLILCALLLIAGCERPFANIPNRCGECPSFCTPFAVESCKPHPNLYSKVECRCDVTRKGGAK